MSLQKIKPFRSKKYRKWVASLPCSNCGIEDDTRVTHHLIGVGQGVMGSKASDLMGMCLCNLCHAALHEGKLDYQEQWKWVAKTLEKAILVEEAFVNEFSI